MSRAVAKWDPQSIHFLCLFPERNEYNRKAAKLWKQPQVMNVVVITIDEPHRLSHRWSFCAVKKHTYLSISWNTPFSSGDIFKKQKHENPLWTETIAVTQVRSIHADLDWQLYIWGRYDLVLMLRLATWLMWPCSVLTGHRAAGRRGQSWKVGKRLRLHSCDWPKPGGQPPMISHVPAEPRRSDPALKEREHDTDDQESVKEQWGRTTMNLKDAERSRHEQH